MAFIKHGVSTSLGPAEIVKTAGEQPKEEKKEPSAAPTPGK